MPKYEYDIFWNIDANDEASLLETVSELGENGWLVVDRIQDRGYLCCRELCEHVWHCAAHGNPLQCQKCGEVYPHPTAYTTEHQPSLELVTPDEDPDP